MKQSDPRGSRLLWRIDEAILDATTKRQRAAIEELPKLQRKSLAESHVRQIILGSPQVGANCSESVAVPVCSCCLGGPQSSRTSFYALV